MTTIEWTQRPGTKGESWNPIRAINRRTGGIGHFCEHVSEGCRNCYAERLQPRFRNPIRYATQDQDKVAILLIQRILEQPLRWRKPRTVFVCSMTDLFGDWVNDHSLDQIFAIMALTPQHTYQVLTKRPERMRNYLLNASAKDENPIWDVAELISDSLGETPHDQLYDNWPLPNVWLGVSVEDQATADARIPALVETPAAMLFVSYEPALGPVGFFDWLGPYGPPGSLQQPPQLDWIIAGGESGPKARPPQRAWFRDVQMQCEAAGVSFFFKQWGGRTHGAGGRLLDGREHLAWPV